MLTLPTLKCLDEVRPYVYRRIRMTYSYMGIALHLWYRVLTTHPPPGYHRVNRRLLENRSLFLLQHRVRCNRKSLPQRSLAGFALVDWWTAEFKAFWSQLSFWYHNCWCSLWKILMTVSWFLLMTLSTSQGGVRVVRVDKNVVLRTQG